MALLLKDSPDLVLKSGRPKRRRKAAVTEASERTLVSATAAYALSKLRVAGKGIIQFAFFSTLMVPPIVYLVPQFVNISELPLINVSLFNSWSGVWLPEAASAFNILLLKSFFDGIPA